MKNTKRHGAPLAGFRSLPTRGRKASRVYTGTLRGARYRLSRRFGVWSLRPYGACRMPTAFSLSAEGAKASIVRRTRNGRA